MDKLRLLEITYTKLSADKAFMAYYLERVHSTGSRTREEICDALRCSPEDYFKLGLCKAPETNAVNFEERLQKICSYSNCSFPDLVHIIKTGQIRDVEEHTLPDLGTNWANILTRKIKKQVGSEGSFPLPSWLINTSVRLGQAGLSTLVILAFIFNFTTIGKSQNTTVFYNKENAHYRDSIQGTTLRDNTFVVLPRWKNS
jgi:DNA-binding Xre family transcriptional regulator